MKKYKILIIIIVLIAIIIAIQLCNYPFVNINIKEMTRAEIVAYAEENENTFFVEFLNGDFCLLTGHNGLLEIHTGTIIVIDKDGKIKRFKSNYCTAYNVVLLLCDCEILKPDEDPNPNRKFKNICELYEVIAINLFWENNQDIDCQDD